MIQKCVHPLDQLRDDACELVGESNSFQLQILKLWFSEWIYWESVD